jgi:lysozyme family protein
MADFLTQYKKTMAVEGIYSNDKDDKGGETWKGIARNYHPTWDGWPVVDKAKTVSNFPSSLADNQELESKVQKFYKYLFWDVFKLDEYPLQLIAGELFDTAVNMGASVAATFLQRSLNVLNKGAKLFADVTVDGKYGPGTHKAALTFFYAVPKSHQLALFYALNCLQGARYIEIAEKNPTQEKYVYGWLLQRVFEEGVG